MNAEGLPLEGIDRIEVTLNKNLCQYIDFRLFKKINRKKYLRLRYFYKYGLHWYLTIQSQRIDPADIRMSIAKTIFELIEINFFDLPATFISLQFIYLNLNWFVSEVREIEFYFDFIPEAIIVADPSRLIHYEDTFYSTDWRKNENRPTRKSNIIIYDRKPRLLKINQMTYDSIIKNDFSYRIEFRLCKYNCQYRSLNNIIGNYSQIIMRYVPFLSIIFHRHFGNSVVVAVDSSDHPFFWAVYTQARLNSRTRYTGTLEKMKPHKSSESENEFYKLISIMKMCNSGYSLSQMLSSACKK